MDRKCMAGRIVAGFLTVLVCMAHGVDAEAQAKELWVDNVEGADTNPGTGRGQQRVQPSVTQQRVGNVPALGRRFSAGVV